MGGISDAGAELKDGSYAVIDFKSSKEAYTNSFIQTAGYAIEIEENGLFNEDGTLNRKLDKQFTSLIVVPFGAEKIEPAIRTDIENYKKGFEAAVYLYRLMGLDKNGN